MLPRVLIVVSFVAIAGCASETTSPGQDLPALANEPYTPAPAPREVLVVEGTVAPHVFGIDLGERTPPTNVTFTGVPTSVLFNLTLSEGPTVVYFFDLYAGEDVAYDSPMTDWKTWDVLLPGWNTSTYGIRVAPWRVEDGFSWTATFTAIYEQSTNAAAPS